MNHEYTQVTQTTRKLTIAVIHYYEKMPMMIRIDDNVVFIEIMV